MLDLHATTAAASLVGTLATGNAIGGICAGGDGASVAGVPIAPNATLVMWGGGTGVIADTLNRIRLISQDQVDPINGEDCLVGAGSLIGHADFDTNLPFRQGARVIYEADNTAGAASYAYTVDLYNGGSVMSSCRWKPGSVTVPQILGAAQVAMTWLTTPFAPAAALPNGKYAIEGATLTGQATATAWGMIRFRHADFGGKAPGFPVIDPFMSTAVIANINHKHNIFDENGNQFNFLSERMGVPCNPVFSVTSAGTGLQIDTLTAMLSAAACSVCLTLTKVA